MKTPAQYFRAGVGAVLLDPDNRVLALERADVPGSWQLPQGGIERDESAENAVVREILEEVGVESQQLELIAQYPEPLAYELPARAWSEKTGRGQVQYWFFFRIPGTVEVKLDAGGEFRDWSWVPLEDLVTQVVEFRRSVYGHLLEFYRARLLPLS